MKKLNIKNYLIIILLFIANNVFAQTKIAKDLDGDGKKDKVYIQDSVIVCELSTENGRKITSAKMYIDEKSYLSESERGFMLHSLTMRGSGFDEYSFDKQAQKIRLVNSYVENIGYMSESVDFLTGKYDVSYSFYDLESDSLFWFSIDTVLSIPPIYFNELNYSVYAALCDSLYNRQLALRKAEIAETFGWTTNKLLLPEEEEAGAWQYKISKIDTLKNYIVQLVTSKNEDDYSTTWISLQIFERKTGRFVQEIDLNEYTHGAFYDRFEKGDFNFDGYEDFSLFEATYTLDNTSSCYFLFNPKTNTFFGSGFEGTNLEFDSSSKTITSNNRCCAGAEEYAATYKLIDNRMVLLELHCLTATRNEENGDVLLDKEGNLIFEEKDCDTPYIDRLFESVGQKKNFQLRMAIYDKDMYGGFVQYKGQKERIPIYFDHAEIIENREEEGRPNVRQLFYNEMYKRENTGTYSFILQGVNIYEADYIRKKDGKKFSLTTIDKE